MESFEWQKASSGLHVLWGSKESFNPWHEVGKRNKKAFLWPQREENSCSWYLKLGICSGSQLGVIFPPCPRAIKQCLERLYFDCHNWWGRGVHYWYLAGRGHGCCLSIRQCTGQPHNKEISSPNCQLCQHWEALPSPHLETTTSLEVSTDLASPELESPVWLSHWDTSQFWELRRRKYRPGQSERPWPDSRRPRHSCEPRTNLFHGFSQPRSQNRVNYAMPTS